MHLTFLLVIAVFSASMPLAQGRTLRVGQEWEFTGRPGDPRPALVIVRIETLPKLGEVVHVSIRGVRMKNALAPGGYSNEVAHMPFARAALERSLTRLAHDSVSLPAFQEGYEQWKAARGGAFTISVREALDFMEQALK